MRALLLKSKFEVFIVQKKNFLNGITATLITFAVSAPLLSCTHEPSRDSNGASGSSTALSETELAEISTTHAQMQVAGDQVNSSAAQAQPYVVMVSIDGYRWDFNQTFSPPELSKMEREGAHAEAMIPVYPSKTFPNHYSLVTGLYANHHGIVSNEFFDPKRDAIYSLPDKKSVEDGTWYGGNPIWVSARKQNMMTASFFWVGSDAKIDGYTPNYYFHYDASVPNEARVDQVLKWLDMEPKKRPHFITLYFSDVDTAGHKNGVKSPQIREAVLKVDAAIARLRQGIALSGLNVDLLIVSDHGLADVDPDKVITLDSTAESANLVKSFTALGRGPQMLLYLKKNEPRKLIEDFKKVLKKQAAHFRVLDPRELKRLHYDGSLRTGDLVIDPDPEYVIGLKESLPAARGANHGWDATRDPNMRGIFFAEGPAFKSGAAVPAFENVNVAPLVLQLLGLKPTTPLDGTPGPLQGLLNGEKSRQ